MRKKICDYCGKEITKKEIMTAVVKIKEWKIYHWQCYLRKIKEEEKEIEMLTKTIEKLEGGEK